jgi:hypothetical protein
VSIAPNTFISILQKILHNSATGLFLLKKE